MAESTNHSDEFMVPWTEMQHGTREHYEYLGPAFYEHARESLVDNLMMLLGLLKGPKLGYQTDRYSHSLQSGTRAYRNDEPVDMVVAALLHDVADGFAPENHSDAAARSFARMSTRRRTGSSSTTVSFRATTTSIITTATAMPERCTRTRRTTTVVSTSVTSTTRTASTRTIR